MNREPSNGRILVADSQPEYVGVVQDILKASRYEVLAALNGREAIELAVNERPDLILLGTGLPDEDGYQVCRRIRERSMAPVVLVSSVVQPAESTRASKAGADGHIGKMMTIESLLDYIRAVFSRSEKR